MTFKSLAPKFLALTATCDIALSLDITSVSSMLLGCVSIGCLFWAGELNEAQNMERKAKSRLNAIYGKTI